MTLRTRSRPWRLFPARGRPPRGQVVRRLAPYRAPPGGWKGFVRGTRAAATSLAAAIVGIMTVGGGALLIEHVWLVDQRDTLKSASNAAGIATTLEMRRVLADDPGIGDADLKAALETVARAYVEANLLHLQTDRLARAKATLAVEVRPDRGQNTVDVNAQADLGGYLFATTLPFLSGVGEIPSMKVEARVENVKIPIEVVLALDVSSSMQVKLDGGTPGPGEKSRMDIVKDAAKALVNILGPDADDRIAVGVVPWHMNVRLADATATAWDSKGWARYPTKRTYGVPYECPESASVCRPDAVVADLRPSAPEDWNGCLDGHRMGSSGTSAANPAVADLFTTPSANAFSHAYYPSLYGFQYECRPYATISDYPSDYFQHKCYDLYDPNNRSWSREAPQWGCEATDPALLPLSTDRTAVIGAIDGLAPIGERTYSALGVLWGQRMLLSTWRTAWGGAVHPVDPASDAGKGVRKAIVLLTDGTDSICGDDNFDCNDSRIGISRTDACTLAKNAGIEIFVVAAMHPDQVSTDFGTSLTACSSQSDDSEQTYVFLNNATQENLQAAFENIANQLQFVQRLY